MWFVKLLIELIKQFQWLLFFLNFTTLQKSSQKSLTFIAAGVIQFVTKNS